MKRWLLKWWLRFTLWLNPPAPITALPTALPVIEPPAGFKSWFAWEAVQFTQDPTAFWFDPYRYGDEPTPDEHREAQDRVAALFGLRVSRPNPYHVLPAYGAQGLMRSGYAQQSALAQAGLRFAPGEWRRV